MTKYSPPRKGFVPTLGPTFWTQSGRRTVSRGLYLISGRLYLITGGFTFRMVTSHSGFSDRPPPISFCRFTFPISPFPLPDAAFWVNAAGGNGIGGGRETPGASWGLSGGRKRCGRGKAGNGNWVGGGKKWGWRGKAGNRNPWTLVNAVRSHFGSNHIVSKSSPSSSRTRTAHA